MIQNEWMTSREVRSIVTFLSTGRTRLRQLLLVDVAVLRDLGLDAHGPHGVGIVLGLAVVLEVPRPLLRDGGDLDVDLIAPRPLDRRLLAGCEGEQPEHEDQRDGGEEDLDRHVVAQLDGETGLSLAATVHDHRPEHQAPGDDAHDQSGDPRARPERGDAVGLVGRGGAFFGEAGEVPVQFRRGAARERFPGRRAGRGTPPPRCRTAG